MNDFKTIIESFTDFLIHRLAVVLPLSFIGIKLILLRLSGHKQDQWKGILNIPEDVCYGALGFIIAGLSGDLPVFMRYFSDSPHALGDIWILFAAGVVVCFGVHLMEQHLVTPQYEAWRATDTLIEEAERNNRLNTPLANSYTVHYFLRWAAFVFFFLMEGIVALFWIAYIGGIVES